MTDSRKEPTTEYDIWGVDEGGPNKGEWSQWTVKPFPTLAAAERFRRRYWPGSVCEPRPGKP